MSSFVSLLAVSGNPYREGELLVVPTGSSLPSNCVKCGAVTSDKLTKTFYWHSPWLYVLIFAGVIFYFIVALVVRRKVKLEIPMCGAHRAWRTRMNLTGVALLIAAVVASVLLSALGVDGGWIALIGIVMGLSGLIVLAVVGSSFSAVCIEESYAKFRGACEPFLATLDSSSLAPPTAA